MKWLTGIGVWLSVMGFAPFITEPHAELSSRALSYDMVAHSLGAAMLGVVFGYRIREHRTNNQPHSAPEWTTTRRDQ
jgi:hypothetical protein